MHLRVLKILIYQSWQDIVWSAMDINHVYHLVVGLKIDEIKIKQSSLSKGIEVTCIGRKKNEI